MANSPSLILASASPRRRQLLSEAGYRFAVQAANIDEDDVPPNLSPADLAEYLARRKAAVVAAQFPDDVVLAADTVVAHGQVILGKPGHPADAERMLRLLGGTVHSVITGVAVVCITTNFSRHTRVISTVHMRPLSEAEIADYLASGEWKGKAGGYGIQDPDPFVTRTSGSHTNIVGLPMEAAVELLKEAGVTPS